MSIKKIIRFTVLNQKGIPQQNNHLNIILESKDCMSNMLIHKKFQMIQIQNISKIKYNPVSTIKNFNQFYWGDVQVYLGLNWVYGIA